MTTPLPVAVQLYTLREALQNDWRRTVTDLAAIGYAGVETAGFNFASAAEAKALFETLGLAVVAAHAPLPLGDDRQAVLDTLAALDCRRLVCAGTGHDQFGNAADIAARADLFNQANAVARDNGLQFGLHNHWWEFGRVDGRLALDILIDQLDDDIFLEIDTYWAQTAGVDAAALVRRLAHRTPLLHIKDGPCEKGEPMVAVGDGEMDWGQVIPAGAAGAEWLIVELDACATDMMTAVRDSYHFLTGAGYAQGRQ